MVVFSKGHKVRLNFRTFAFKTQHNYAQDKNKSRLEL